MFVAYCQGAATKTLRIGRVSTITKNESSVVVQRFRPLSDGRLRVRWIPMENVDAYGASTPALETLHCRQIMTTLQLHDGVLSHAAARRLDKSGWRLDESDLVEEAAVVEVPREVAVASYARLEEFRQFMKGGLPVLADMSAEHRPAVLVTFEGDECRRRWLAEGRVDFLEVFCGFQELTFRVRECGLIASDGIDNKVVSMGQVWPLEVEEVRKQCAWLIVKALQPLCVHSGTPCTHMSRIGKQDHETHSHSPMLVQFTIAICEYQDSLGRLASNENPSGSMLPLEEQWVAAFGRPEAPKGNWRYVKSDGCQFKVIFPGIGDEGRPMQKCKQWMSNFDLGPLNLRCRKPAALAGTSHEHRQIRGTMKMQDGRWISVATYSGKYTPEECTVYARCLAKALKDVSRRPVPGRKESQLEKLAGELEVPVRTHKSKVQQFKIFAGTAVAADSEETEAQREARREKHEVDSAAADAKWKELAKKKDWNQVKADLDVYKHSGEKVTVDPRLEESYKVRVLEGTGFAPGMTRDGLTEADMQAAREVLKRKAAAFWLEGAPRTTILGVSHDTIPTGPPCKTPPHALKGESAEWIDEQLEKEVKRGQLERGSSPWGSPPFPTREFAEHRKQRKRRMVIDYRRVNSRTLRAIYHLRKASDVLSSAAGSIWMSMLDAVTGFNLVVNTGRARLMLAIIARSGQFLPRCLTFGPHNGPEDFGFVVDRVFSPGKRSARRFCKEWLAYVDDLTVRTGRVVDGLFLTDREASERIKQAVAKAAEQANSKDIQSPSEAFAALGFSSEGLGREAGCAKGLKHVSLGLGPQFSSDPCPYAHVAVSLGLGPQYCSDPSPYAHVSVSLGLGPQYSSDPSPYAHAWRKPSWKTEKERLNGLGHALTRVVRHGEGDLPRRADGFFSIRAVVQTRSIKDWVGSRQDIFEIVRQQTKERFEIRGIHDQQGAEEFCIRAVQGHSRGIIEEDSVFTEFGPEDVNWTGFIFHGTWGENVPKIVKEGLKAGADLPGKKNRDHVMCALRVDPNAEVSGIRTGTTTVVSIDAAMLKKALAKEGLKLYISFGCGCDGQKGWQKHRSLVPVRLVLGKGHSQ